MSPPRNAVITGAAQGIGRAIALRLSAQGCNVVVNDLSFHADILNALVAEIVAKGNKAISFAGDATEEKIVQGLVDKCVNTYGRLDIMVCNAGTASIGPITECRWDEVDRLFNINLRSAWFGYQLAARQMIAQYEEDKKLGRKLKGGRIIGAASAAGKKGFPSMAAYSVSKFAIRGLTQSAAQEWGPYGITVNAYCPGIIDTPLIAQLGEQLSAVLSTKDADPKVMWENQSSVKRMGEGKDVAALVAFFASEDSGFVTGQNILCDGGTLFD
ncbi:NAD-binding protein [Mycena crocata]|nr:NAD-binding protein [Mycena crocata]